MRSLSVDYTFIKRLGLLVLATIIPCFLTPAFSMPRFTVDFHGEEREYFVYAPNSISTGRHKKIPVVILLHGGGGNALQFEASTAFNNTAEKNGFLAVYLEGTRIPLLGKGRTWNAEKCCGTAAKQNVDDIGFVRAVITALPRNYPIDLTRVYAAGHSNGAMLAYRLACEMPDRIAAIAAVAGPELSSCNPQKPISILHIHGTDDNCMLYDPSNVAPLGFCPQREAGPKQSGGCVQVAINELVGTSLPLTCHDTPAISEVIERWRTRNRCSELVQKIRYTDTATCTETLCAEQSAVRFCSIAGGGHAWPGSTPPKVCRQRPGGKACATLHRIMGRNVPDLDTNQIIWDFFAGHSLHSE